MTITSYSKKTWNKERILDTDLNRMEEGIDSAKKARSAKEPVRVATTANVTLSGAQTIDGVAVVADDRVLVKNQSTGSQNGIYDVKAGAWVRAVDFDADSKVKGGILVPVSEGTQAGLWMLTTNDPIVIGTTALVFANINALLDHGLLSGLGDDDHPQYETSAEVDAKFTTHENAVNPHPTYETSAEAAAKITAHEAAGNPHPGYMQDGEAAGGDLGGTFPNPEVAKASKSFALTGDISPAAIAAQADNYNPSGLADASTIRVSLTGGQTMTGLAGGADGRVLVIHNIDTADTLTLSHEDTASTAANRFDLPEADDLEIAPRSSVTLQYDATSSRWRIMGGAGVGGGAGLVGSFMFMGG